MKEPPLIGIISKLNERFVQKTLANKKVVKKMESKERYWGNSRFFSWSFVVIWMGLIFYLSHQVADQSRTLSDETLYIMIPTIKIFQGLFFLVLAVWGGSKLKKQGITIGMKEIVAIGAVICLLYILSVEMRHAVVPPDLPNAIRKHAHFFIYLVLGILVKNALNNSGIAGVKGIGISLLICALYAVSDEFHQVFVPGRGGRLSDVFIDSSGAGIGLIVSVLFNKIRRKRTASLVSNDSRNRKD